MDSDDLYYDNYEDDETNPDNYLYNNDYDFYHQNETLAAGYLLENENDDDDETEAEKEKEIVKKLSSSPSEPPKQQLQIRESDEETSEKSESPELKHHSPVNVLKAPSPSDVIPETMEKLIKTVPFLEIPIHFGFSRYVINTLNHPKTSVVYSHKHFGNAVQLKSLEEVYLYLCENDIQIPISFFTFESSVRSGYTFYTRIWSEITHKEDLSEGLEKIPIPVICSKKKRPGTTLAKYVTNSFPGEDLDFFKIKKIEDDDGFLLCCDCPDDCKDKLKCPCFLKTLDNCSNKTRELKGDENIGYKYQRLDNPQISGIFECNKKCKCRKSTCFNRVAQNGIVCKLQLFMTDKKGWGVRTLCDIPKGTFVCNYSGAIVSAQYANAVSNNWNDGLWKYLSVLQPSHEFKEGYEADVVEPEEEEEEACSTSLQHQPQQQQQQSRNCTTELSNDDWKDFLEEDSCTSPLAPSSPVILEQASSTFSPITTRQRKRKLRTVPYSPAGRVLRSENCKGTFEESKPLVTVTGRFGFLQTSLKGVTILSRYNIRSKNMSEVCLMPSQRKSGKISKSMFLGDYCRMQIGQPDQHYRELELQKEHSFRTDKIIASSNLNRQFVIDHVLPSVKTATSPLEQGDTFAVCLPNLSPSSAQLTPTQSSTISPTQSSTIPPTQSSTIPPTQSSTIPPTQSSTIPPTQSSTIPPTQPTTMPSRKLGYSRRITQKLGKRNRQDKTTNKVSILKKRVGWRRRKGRKLCSLKTQNKKKSPANRQHPLLTLDLNIDGREFGNIGRYLNHSCNPNLFPQYVFVDTHDLRFPQITFFASRNIQAGEELTWDYQYAEGEVNYQKEPEDGKKHKKDQEQGDEQQQQQSPTGNHDDNNAMISLTFPHKSLAAIRKKNVGLGKGNRRKSSKQNMLSLPCYCGQDNCSNKIC